MKEIVELRSKPELKIILNKIDFEVIDASEPTNSGNYSYVNLKNVTLNLEKTNWLFSAFTIIIGIVFNSAELRKYKTKPNLILETDMQNLKIWLIDADLEQAKKLSELIKNKL